MSNDANVEHFEGLIDPSDPVKGGEFLQAARIVAGEAKGQRGVFTFSGYTQSREEILYTLEAHGRYERVEDIIRVFFDNPPNHGESFAF